MKYGFMMMAALVLSGCSQPMVTGASATELCKLTVNNYAVYRDEGPAKTYASLFTQDGTFELGGTVTTGHEALMARHTAATKAALWRHNMTNIQVGDNGGALVGISRFTVFTGPHPEPASGPSGFTRQIIGDYLDEFVMEDGLCKIKSRRVNVVFDNKLGE